MAQQDIGNERLAEAIEQLAQAIAAKGGEGVAGAEEAGEAAAAGGSVMDVPTDLEGIQVWLGTAQDKLIEYLPQLAAAIVIVLIGWIVTKLITAFVSKALNRSKLDPTLTKFLTSCLHMVLMAFVLISAITKLGVNTTSFIAILGAAGFAIGFAMQGSLSNFAAGVMMMIFRPMKVGELVEAGGVLGTVADVGVFATTINTLENKKAIVANSSITGGNIINYTANGMLRVDMTFGIAYEADMNAAMKIMLGILSGDGRVLKEPEPTVACVGHGDSSVDFVCRPHVKPEDYWGVWFDTHKAVKEAFDAAGIGIPFPQRDVHMIQAG
jgi:small conductance mechanosensitive channel